MPTDVSRIIGRPGPLPDRPPFGLAFGGEQSGTLTLAIAPDGSVLGRLDEVEGLPIEPSVEAARQTGSDVRETGDRRDADPGLLVWPWSAATASTSSR